MHTVHWAGWERLTSRYKLLRKVQLGAQLQLQLLPPIRFVWGSELRRVKEPTLKEEN